MSSPVGPHSTERAMRHDDDIGGKPRHFVDRMADIDDRHSALIAQALDIGKYLALARMIERRQGSSIKQQAAGLSASARPMATRCFSPPER